MDYALTHHWGVLRRGVQKMAIGYGGGPGYSFVKEPLTLDFGGKPR